MSIILTVDPGTAHTGIAVWDSKYWKKDYQESFQFGVTVDVKQGLDNMFAALHLAIARDLGIHGDVEAVYVESPAAFLSCARGLAAIADVMDTRAVCGWFSGYFQELATVQYVPVIDWKGNLPKEVANRRVREKIKLEGQLSTHSLDAIGLGLYLQGEFN